MAKQQQQEASPESASTESTTGARPIAKFNGSGGLSVAVWKHKVEGGGEHYSIRMDRTFKNDAGEYESTPYLREGDLLRAQKLMGQADDWIEQDRAKHRGGQDRTAAAR
jgi:hypothetical protein